MQISIILGPGQGVNLGPYFSITANDGEVNPASASLNELLSGTKTFNVSDLATKVYVTSLGTCTTQLVLDILDLPGAPTLTPTLVPTIPPTLTPTVVPTTLTPTVTPTLVPTAIPTLIPTVSPTVHPTTLVPTNTPTVTPTLLPTITPTIVPTLPPGCTNTNSEGFANPDTLIGSKALSNGVTITTTYTGPSPSVVPAPRGSGMQVCGGSYFFHPDAAYIGQLPGAFTFTINFDSPVNDIVLLTISMGYNTYPGVQECLTLNTNAGTPDLAILEGCGGMSATGNVLCGATSFPDNTGGATRISTALPYTQLTITANPNGTLAGIGVNICYACPVIPTITPTLTPTLTPTDSPTITPTTPPPTMTPTILPLCDIIGTAGEVEV